MRKPCKFTENNLSLHQANPSTKLNSIVGYIVFSITAELFTSHISIVASDLKEL